MSKKLKPSRLLHSNNAQTIQKKYIKLPHILQWILNIFKTTGRQINSK